MRVNPSVAIGLFGVITFTLGIIFLLSVPQRPVGTHWHAKGCPGQGDLVYHADYIDEFPEGCKEFILVDDKTDQPINSIWADELRRNSYEVR